MYGYGLYKSAGVEGAESLRSFSEQSRVAKETGRTLPALFVGDLGRADIQAVLLHNRYDSNWGEPPMAYGRTYSQAAWRRWCRATLGSPPREDRVRHRLALRARPVRLGLRGVQHLRLGGEMMLN